MLSSARTYVSLFGDRVFVGLVLVTGLSMGALFGYVAGSSFVFQDQYGLSEQEFGLAFGRAILEMQPLAFDVTELFEAAQEACHKTHAILARQKRQVGDGE